MTIGNGVSCINFRLKVPSIHSFDTNQSFAVCLGLVFYRSTNPNQTKPNYFHVVCVFSLQSILGHMLDLKSIPSRKLTYPRDKAYLKMIFLFPRWDMLVPWRVNQHLGELDFQHPTFWTQGQLLVSHRNGNSWLLWMEKNGGWGVGKKVDWKVAPPQKLRIFLRGLWSFLIIFDFWSPKFTVPAGENLPVGYLLFDRYACLDRYC